MIEREQVMQNHVFSVHNVRCHVQTHLSFIQLNTQCGSMGRASPLIRGVDSRVIQLVYRSLWARHWTSNCSGCHEECCLNGFSINELHFHEWENVTNSVCFVELSRLEGCYNNTRPFNGRFVSDLMFTVMDLPFWSRALVYGTEVLVSALQHRISKSSDSFNLKANCLKW